MSTTNLLQTKYLHTGWYALLENFKELPQLKVWIAVNINKTIQSNVFIHTLEKKKNVSSTL